MQKCTGTNVFNLIIGPYHINDRWQESGCETACRHTRVSMYLVYACCCSTLYPLSQHVTLTHRGCTASNRNKGRGTPRPRIPHMCELINIPSDHKPDTLQFCTDLADDPAAKNKSRDRQINN